MSSPLLLAAATGAAAAFNPCGIGMLPSCVGALVGRPADGSWPRALGEGLLVGAGMTGGLLCLFLAVAAVFASVIGWLARHVPLLGEGVAVALMAWGVAILLSPRRFLLSLPLPQVGGGDRAGVLAAAVYGLAYGLASIGCTFPLFAALLAQAATAGATIGPALVIVSYALGMGAALTLLAAAARLARAQLERLLTSVAVRLERLSGFLVTASGVYVLVYWLRAGG